MTKYQNHRASARWLALLPHKGLRIESLAMLALASREKRSVIGIDPVFTRPLPAVWVMNMSGTMIYRMIQQGLYIYERIRT